MKQPKMFSVSLKKKKKFADMIHHMLIYIILIIQNLYK